MKGIVLAGGTGSRLRPATLALSKQLLTIFDKPLVYFPISTLMAAGIRDILIISTPEHLEMFRKLLGDGSQLGVSFSYLAQPAPKGIAESFIIGEKFINNDSCGLVLGDNIFHGSGIGTSLKENISKEGADIYAFYVNNPRDYGVIELDLNETPISIEEKPLKPKSNLAVTGLYFFDNTVSERAKLVEPSKRGELEITSLINSYLLDKKLNVHRISRGSAWFDTGTFKSMHDAATYVRIIQERTNLQIACLEELSLRQGWINPDSARQVAKLNGTEALNYIDGIIEDLGLD